MHRPARTPLLLALLLIAAGSVPSRVAADEVAGPPITEQQVVALVQLTCEALQRDAATTLAAINRGDAPFRDAANPALYSFVYDNEARMVAHLNPELVGRLLRGVPDARGHLFRDEIVQRAMEGEQGWVNYWYQRPEGGEPLPKTTYFRSVRASDGRTLVVCAGKYLHPAPAVPSPSPSAPTSR